LGAMPALSKAISSPAAALIILALLLVLGAAFRQGIKQVGIDTWKESAGYLRAFKQGNRNVGRGAVLIFCLAYVWGRWVLIAAVLCLVLFAWVL
jgi:hypothetical protein